MQIKTKNLTHVYSKRTPNEFIAISDVNVTIEQGEIIGIIGETGSGKTTFVQHLNALLLPTTGTVVIGSQEIKNSKRKIKNIKEIRKKIGVVFQFAEYQLFEETIQKDIIFGPVNMGVSKEESIERAKKYIEIVGMDQSFLTKSPFNLSGGQKRRVAIAGILAMEPDVLIFDEPTAGLDPVGMREVLDLFTKLNKLGKTIVIVTHNLDHVLEITNKTMLFSRSKLVKFDKTSKVLRDIKFLKENNMQPPKLIDFILKLESNGFKIKKEIKSINELVKIISEGDKND
ncbi:MAG: energy-coupling factor transporter ATPase [Mycoplasma sp.]|nr:energy-coupling factor transporter ATPase [Mycoplasma sp.]